MEMIRRFRKKPVVIEAIQWAGDTTAQDIDEFMGGELQVDENGDYYIDTLEGKMHLTWGDWIIKGVNGEFYPCKPDIFEKTYEEVVDDARE